jgi:hypothetical protein
MMTQCVIFIILTVGIKRFTFQQLQFATMGFSSHNLVVGVKDTSLIYKVILGVLIRFQALFTIALYFLHCENKNNYYHFL